MSKIQIVIGDQRFRTTLLTAESPKTCSYIRTHLPLEGELVHSSWSGEAVFCYFSKLLGECEPENQSVYGAIGEIFFFPPRKELLMVHGRAHFRFRDGQVSPNLFARVNPESLAEFAEACRLTQMRGAKRLTIESA